ncbi:MAG: hypothetical protein CMJ49_07060 [Planctomycetaceae bacterium]|nr:hypothetical protein [Planctomycetaceae bacterium]
MTSVSNRPISQPLLLAWCGWLLASLLLHLMLAGAGAFEVREGLIQPIQRMLQSVMIGLVVIWPTWRLSQAHRDEGEWHVLSNWLCLVLVLQVTIWPLRYLIGQSDALGWSVQRTWVIDLTFVAWSWLVAAWVRLGVRRGTPAARSIVLVIIILLLLAGPLVATWTRRPEIGAISPYVSLWRLADPYVRLETAVEVSRSAGVAVLGIAVWMLGRDAGGGGHPADPTL